MNDETLHFVLEAVDMVATHGWKLLPQVGGLDLQNSSFRSSKKDFLVQRIVRRITESETNEWEGCCIEITVVDSIIFSMNHFIFYIFSVYF